MVRFWFMVEIVLTIQFSIAHIEFKYTEMLPNEAWFKGFEFGVKRV